MATSLTTTYAGQAAMDYFQAAFLTINSLTNGSLTVRENIKYKQVVKRGIVEDALQGATCDFTDSSTVTIDERVLTLKRFDASVQICKEDFVQDWEVVNMGNSAWKAVPTATLGDFIITSLLGQTLSALETMIWQGTAGANSFAGFETLFAADATVVDVAAATVTAANVIDELGKIKAAMSTAVKTQPDVEIVVSYNIAEAYVDALGGFAALKNVAGTENVSDRGANGYEGRGAMWYNGQQLSFGGIPIRVANGLSDNTAVGTYVRNLWFGTDLLADTTQVRVKDMTEVDLSDNVRFKAMFGAGVQYGSGADVVFYS